MSTSSGTAAFPIQRELFPRSEVSEWLPAKPPKRYRPSDLMERIRSMSSRAAGCFASLAWFAAQFKKSRATIARWISTLKANNLIRVILRGPTSARYEVIPQSETSSEPRPLLIRTGVFYKKRASQPTPKPVRDDKAADARIFAWLDEMEEMRRKYRQLRLTGRCA